MSRPVRIEFPSALYYVTARSDQREDIFASSRRKPPAHTPTDKSPNTSA